jgi:hypothetical protein
MGKNLDCVIYFIIICLSFMTIRCGSDPVTQDGHIMDTSFAPPIDLSECWCLSGRYAFFGDALPGMPEYFRVRAIPLRLDVMFGFENPLPVLQHTTAVRVSLAKGLQLEFLNGQDVLQHAMPYHQLDQIHCDQKTLIIEKRRQTAGEAVRGSTVITHTLTLDENRALILKTDITGRSHSLIFSYDRPRETYGARFRRIEE